MVFDTASLVPKVGSVSSMAINILIWGGIIVLMLTVIGVLIYFRFFRKKYNLDIEFKLTRSDGRMTNAEWGKGFFDTKKGVVFLKRPKMKEVPMKIMDIRKYLQGNRVMTVIQVGPEDYRPVLNDSWTEHVQMYKDDTTGEVIEVKESILNIKVDSGLNKAWKSAWDAAAKNAYSIRSFFTQFQTPIAIGIVLICCFVGFAILWSKIG